ncbi:acyltransferase [Paracoccus sp. SY]|uniref:acyltransferase n=1 Tax=Paracoccus sp. SY TaxID=1330255 RepID=UPI000CD1843F|nr:acyltransferase [Paracoccus sp. SY]
MVDTPKGVEDFTVRGEGNLVTLGDGSRCTRILVIGHRNTIRVGARCRLNGQIVIKCDDGLIEIGDETSSMGIRLHMHETSHIVIGRDCMFSGGISMDTSDNHSIIDVASGKRINPCKPIAIGDHVWVGQHSTILKGATIGSHSVIGAGSIVRGAIPDNSLAVGSPAKVIRSGVTWDRRRLPA